MKRTAILLGLILPFCLAIRVKEFVYESNIPDDGPNSEETEEQFFAFDNNEVEFTWQDMPLEALGKRISVHFTGQGPIDWITDALVNALSFFLHPVVLDIIQLVVKSPIEHIVNGVNDAINKIFKP
nr:unnamed protein product [Callosobruchus chinensis]